MWFILCIILSISLYGADNIPLPFGVHDEMIAMEEIALSPNEEDIVELIMGDIFRDNGHGARERLQATMVNRLRDQPEEVRLALIRTYHLKPFPIYSGKLKEEVSLKLLELLSDSIVDVIEDEERKSQEWELEAKDRCKKMTTAILSGLIGLGGAAVGATIGAVITASIDC